MQPRTSAITTGTGTGTETGTETTSCDAATSCHLHEIKNTIIEETYHEPELLVTFPFAIAKVHDRFISGVDTKNTLKLFSQIELAWWHYQDNYADVYSALPRFNKLKKFGSVLFDHSPLLAPLCGEYETMYNEFMSIRAKVPIVGCVLLSSDLKNIVLVCTWDGNYWGSPRGRMKVDEEDCFEGAMRQVLEETGFHATPFTSRKPFLQAKERGREVTLFLCTSVPEDTVFIPRTQKEISAVKFFPLHEAPRGSYYNKEIRAALKQVQKKTRKAQEY